jgi:hypothetical protein
LAVRIYGINKYDDDDDDDDDDENLDAVERKQCLRLGLES